MVRTQKNSGFTLLEVMIALAIVGIALVVMLGLVQRSVLANSRLQQLTRATLLAKQKMSEIEHGVRLLDELQQGEFAEPNQGFSWRADYTPTPLTGIEQVDISVIWGSEENNELVTLTSFVRETR